MREIRLSGLEGGGAEPNRLSLPLSKLSLDARLREPARGRTKQTLNKGPEEDWKQQPLIERRDEQPET